MEVSTLADTLEFDERSHFVFEMDNNCNDLCSMARALDTDLPVWFAEYCPRMDERMKILDQVPFYGPAGRHRLPADIDAASLSSIVVSTPPLCILSSGHYLVSVCSGTFRSEIPLTVQRCQASTWTWIYQKTFTILDRTILISRIPR
jgi:hypothetical protein